MKFFILIGLFVFVFYPKAYSQGNSAFNLNFSQKGINTKLPQNWWANGESYDYASDSISDSKPFRYSVSCESKQSATAFSMGNLSNYVIAYPLRGHKVTFSGFIKTDNVTNGAATLYIFSYASDSLVKTAMNYDNMVSGTQNWTKVSVSLDVGASCDYIIVGGRIKGYGKAWFGGFALECDGNPVNEIQAYAANPKMTDWINRHEKPLPDQISDTMYKTLNLDFFNPYKYIALGENTHGSSEEFVAKGEMIKSMILHNGVKVIAFEKGIAEGDLVDRCLQNNGLRLTEAWQKFSSSPWNNTEILNFLKWVAAYNSQVEINARVHFVGIDMQTFGDATNKLKSYAQARTDKVLLSRVIHLGKLQKSSAVYMYRNGFRWLKRSAARKYVHAAKAVLNRTRIITDSSWVPEYGLLLYQAAVYYSSRDLNSAYHYRDNCMASNLINASKTFNSGKVVIWAHNAHIANQRGAMGSYLKIKFGDSMAVVGFGTDQGSYNAINRYTNENIVKKQAVQFTPTNTESYEYILSQSRIPNFILPLKEISFNDSANLLNHVRLFREATQVTDAQFQPYNLGKSFDYLVFIKKTSPSHDFEVH